MIQRVQTLYLFIVAILMLSLNFVSLAELISPDAVYKFDVFGAYTALTAESTLVYPTWGLFIINTLIVLLSFVAIFMFKKRMLQMRVVIYSSIFLVAFYGLFYGFYWMTKEQLGIVNMHIGIPLAFPAISLILNVMTIRNIRADEALVRSLNRIR
ncbi:MAG: DUF4293 domain-containing protein [Tannerellaceae bacterium]|nr:DUF4293 domain-containing protein [Porphyromonadaceae bacterium]